VKPDGNWIITIESTLGAQSLRVSLETHDGSVDGTLRGAFGEVDFRGGTIDGSRLAWRAEVEQPIPLTLRFAAVVDTDAMLGEVVLGTTGKAKFSGRRATETGERERTPIEELWGEIRTLGLESYVAELDTLGYTVVPPAVAFPDGLPDRLLEAVLDVAERRTGTRPDLLTNSVAEQSAKAAGGMPLGDTMPFLLQEGRPFEEALMNPALLALVTHLCGRSVVLSAMFSSIKGPNPVTLPLHADNRLPAPLPPYAVVCNATIALTEYTRAGGCLAVVPGSHRHSYPPQGREAQLGPGGNPNARPVECAPGSLLVWHGNTWHGAYPRSDPGLRVSLVQYFSRPQLRTLDDLRDQMSEESLDRNPPRFAVLTQQGLADGYASASDVTTRTARAGKVMAKAALSAGQFVPTLDG
jgi:hypothetical protein